MAEDRTQNGEIDQIVLVHAETIRRFNVIQVIIAIFSSIGSCAMTVGFCLSFKNFELSNIITASGAGLSLLCGLIRVGTNSKYQHSENQAIRKTLRCLESMRTNVNCGVFENVQLVVCAMCLKTENPLLTTPCCSVPKTCEICPSCECCSTGCSKCGKCVPKCCSSDSKLCKLLESATLSILPGWVLLSSIKDFQKAIYITTAKPSTTKSLLKTWYTLSPFRKVTEILEGGFSVIGLISGLYLIYKYGSYVCKARKEQEKLSSFVLARKIKEISKITRCRSCRSHMGCEQHGERGTQDVDPSWIHLEQLPLSATVDMLKIPDDIIHLCASANRTDEAPVPSSVEIEDVEIQERTADEEHNETGHGTEPSGDQISRNQTGIELQERKTAEAPNDTGPENEPSSDRTLPDEQPCISSDRVISGEPIYENT